MSEHGTGTGTRIRTGTGNGTKLEIVILRSVLVIPEFEHGTKFWESRESVRSCDSGASRADEFQGGTSARGVTGDVTGLRLAEVCQQSHVSVMGRNSIPPSRISFQDPDVWVAYGELAGFHAAVGFEIKAETPKSCHGEWQSLEQRSKSGALGNIKQGWRSKKH